MDKDQLREAIPAILIGYGNRQEPILHTPANITTEDIDLKLKLGVCLIAVDRPALQRCYELEAIEGITGPLMGGLVASLMEDRAPKRIAVVPREKLVPSSSWAHFSRIVGRHELLNPGGITRARRRCRVVYPTGDVR